MKILVKENKKYHVVEVGFHSSCLPFEFRDFFAFTVPTKIARMLRACDHFWPMLASARKRNGVSARNLSKDYFC